MADIDIKLNSCARKPSGGGKRPGVECVGKPSLNRRLFGIISEAVTEALAAWPAEAGPEPLARLVAQALKLRLGEPAAYAGQRSHEVGPIDKDGEKFLSPIQLASRWHIHPETARRMLRRRQLSSVLVARHRLVPVSEVEYFEQQGLIPRQQP